MLRSNDLGLLKQDGCQLAISTDIFRGLMEATRGDPCTTGCAYFNGGTCPAYRKHHTNSSHVDQSGLVGGKWQGMTVKQIAAQEGISLNEVRRRKLAGSYASSRN